MSGGDLRACNQQCWTWLSGTTRDAWIYTGPTDACGHQPDPATGHWKWNTRPGPQHPHQEHR